MKKLVVQQVKKECNLFEIHKLFPNINEIKIHSYKTEYDLSDYWCLTCRIELNGRFHNTNIIME